MAKTEPIDQAAARQQILDMMASAVYEELDKFAVNGEDPVCLELVLNVTLVNFVDLLQMSGFLPTEMLEGPLKNINALREAAINAGLTGIQAFVREKKTRIILVT